MIHSKMRLAPTAELPVGSARSCAAVHLYCKRLLYSSSSPKNPSHVKIDLTYIVDPFANMMQSDLSFGKRVIVCPCHALPTLTLLMIGSYEILNHRCSS